MPVTPARNTVNMITKVSTSSPRKTETSAATIKIMIRKLLNWERNSFTTDVFSSLSSFFPYL
jgi:hypothetical protein